MESHTGGHIDLGGKRPTAASPRVVTADATDDRASFSALYDLYDHYFEVLPADTQDLLDEAHALRYQVYCVEHAFEDPAAQAVAGREADSYDPHSVHAVLIYRPTAQVVGCVRLILPSPADRSATLPMRDLLSPTERARLDRYPLDRTAEISRYAVSKAFRRREGESLYPDVQFSGLRQSDARRLLPHMSLGLIRGVSKLAEDHGISYLCAAMVPALMRLLERLGLTFESLGPLLDYHGQRQPCIASVDGLTAGLATRDTEYLRFVESRPKRSSTD